MLFQIVLEVWVSTNPGNQDKFYKITFKTHEGHYEFPVKSFRLINVLATLQVTVNQQFKPF